MDFVYDLKGDEVKVNRESVRVCVIDKECNLLKTIILPYKRKGMLFALGGAWPNLLVLNSDEDLLVTYPDKAEVYLCTRKNR